MDVYEAWPRPHLHLLNSRPPTCLLGSERCSMEVMFAVRGSNKLLVTLSYVCHRLPHGNVSKLALCLGNHNSHSSSVMSTNKGYSITTGKGSNEVVWTVDADLAAGQLLYLSGDLHVLGNWQPEMAILMSRTEDENLWKAEVEIPSGVNFKYNYYIKDKTCPSADITWRTGPEFSLSVPSSTKQDKKISVRDSWKKFQSESPVHVWGSWIEETYPTVKPLVSAPSKDGCEILQHLEIDSEDPKSYLSDLKDQDKLYYGKDNGGNDRLDVPKSWSSKMEQPVEEPWFLISSIVFLVSKDKMIQHVAKNNDSADEIAKEMEIYNQQLHATDKLLPAYESHPISKRDSVSTTILINSSICTMQRIAVLEDGKLVELLLEPVKSDVQCDSVYVGVVTKFVPHMGGAFVNIGSSRPSLMEIKQNREPFIFPPFRQRTKKVKINGLLLGTLEEHMPANKIEYMQDDVEASEDIAESISRDDFLHFTVTDHEEHDDDDVDILEVKQSDSSITAEYGDVEADYRTFLDGKHNLGSKITNTCFPVETEASNKYLLPCPQDGRGSEYVSTDENKWDQVCKGTKIIVQVVKEGLGTKGPQLTAYPKLRSRFWILITRYDKIGVSKKISGIERTRLKVIAKSLQPPGFGLTVRTVAAGHSLEELQKDLEGLLSTWKSIIEHAMSAALAADEGVEGAIPVILHRAMGQTVSVVQDYFNENVKKLIVDSPRTYHEVTNYLQELAPDLCNRVELYDKRVPLFNEFNVEEEIDSILSKRVPLANGGSLVIEQTEALVSIDVNGGHVMFGQGTSQEKAILDVNLAAAKQIARELRLRDIGGIIVVDFIDMGDESNKRLVYEEMKGAVESDRSTVKVSELSKHGLMEITRKRVRPSVTFMISEPCTCCHATGRVEALETSFSKIEQEICRLLAMMDQKADPENPKSWPRLILRVDHHMCGYLTSGKRTRLAILSSSLKVWILLKVARGFIRGAFEVKPFTDGKANKNQHKAAIAVLRQAATGASNSGRKVTIVPVKRRKASGK
ncbi:hypothetical protein K2173_000576 [Erythroxylum novogranatense]|uniref:CBM20 domain-containing protein n=1 Tax=Erythroxylum novogranatense TaxID=1862640 RepID=A0AAV8S7M9_9ROSI|nr:hypothetical protein K2173_000576 [Erythroxylum novogranatense]